ncbi:DUF4404 family protein [Massilia sp. DWR3-1-1]|uniref:DUF4404 family protein n=1 Tax=Massilia sp. DWR3-1-1 TaxID=2804559 RepID=UPI003CF3D04D
MSNDHAAQLQQRLQTLHNDIASTGEVDPELKDLLHRLDGDIKTLLERRLAAGTVDQTPESSTYGLAERSQELSAKFAVKHPHLEPALRELGNMLSSMGI